MYYGLANQGSFKLGISTVKIETNSNRLKDFTKPKGLVIGVDREYIYPIDGATLFPFSDLTERKTFDKIKQCLSDRKVDAVVSDMVIIIFLIKYIIKKS